MQKLYDLIMFNVRAKLENDTVRNYIGYLWWILEPCLLAGIYYIVFKLILDRGEDNYIQFLFIGVISWKWFASSVQGGSSSILSNRALYKKIYLPKIIFPWIDVIYYSVKFIIILAFVVFLYTILGYPSLGKIYYLPLLLICQFTFSLGLATFLASILPYFVDLKIIISLCIRLAFYPSGVLFDLSRVPEKYTLIVDLNPMAHAIQALRDIVMFGKAPNSYSLLLLFTLGLVLYGFGFFIIKKLDKDYAKISF